MPATVNTSGYDLVVGPDPDGRHILVAAGEKFPQPQAALDAPAAPAEPPTKKPAKSVAASPEGASA